MLLLVPLAASCASFGPVELVDHDRFRARAATDANGGVEVAAALLLPEEIEAIFGLDLTAKGVEPIWLEFANTGDEPVHFLLSGMDPEYFAPNEVGRAFRKRFSGERNESVTGHLEALAIDSRTAIEPGEVVTGFAYSNVEQGAQVLDLDFLGSRWATSITLYVPDPERGGTEELIEDIRTRYSPPELVDVGDDRLRAMLTQLPGYSEDEDGAPLAPLNLVMIGDLEQGVSAFQRRGFRKVSAPERYVFQRPQDFAGAKSAHWVEPQPHRIRMWQTPLRYEGKPVWLGQATMPIGGRFSKKERGVDRYVDQVRDSVVADLTLSQHVVKLGRVGGAGWPGHAKDLETDGLRWVVVVDERATALDELEFFHWMDQADASNVK
ncbi:MAG: LssY C-terminal domain-containing protein [Planctomycetota bacterium]